MAKNSLEKMEQDKKYFVAINANENIGPARFKKLASFFPKMEDAWQATFSELKEAGLDERTIESLEKTFKKVDPEAEMEKLKKEGIEVIIKGEKKYPKLLAEIYDPPAILYLRGEIIEADELSLAVVGTRKLSPYGRQVTPEIVSLVAGQGVTIVSGLARGIDTLAHKNALLAGGRTIAVLAGGLDKNSIYPPENRQLGEEIVADHGAIISEYHLRTPPLRQNFPTRNRLISGLALATLVIEAGEKSGALLTARHSLEQGRDVCAVPGSIYSKVSFGSNNLLKMGARVVTSADDVLDELNIEATSKEIKARKIIPDNKEEEILLQVLSDEPLPIDKIINKTKLDTAKVSATLTMMEMKGKVRNVGAASYVLKR